MTFSNDESRSFTHKPMVARRQLHASAGALVVIVLVAVAATLSLRGTPQAGPVATARPTQPIIVKAPVRELPPQRMQATDQAKSGRGS